MRKKLLSYILLFFLGIGCSMTFAQDQEAYPKVAHQDTIRLIKFSPDHSFILTAGDDGMVRLWDVRKGNMLRAFKHGYDIHKVYIHPTGNLMISSDNKYSNCLWDLEEGKVLKCLSGQIVEGFTPDGKNMIVVEYGNDGKRYAALSFISLDGYQKKNFPHKIYTEGSIGKIYFFKGDHNFLITQDKNLLEFNSEKGIVKEKYSLKDKQDLVAITSDQKYYTLPGDKQIYDLKKNKRTVDLEEPMKAGTGSYFWFMDEDKKLVSVYNKEITIFETDSGRVVKKLFPEGNMYAVSEDLKLMAVTDGKNLSLKNPESGEVLYNYVAEDLIKRTGYQNYLKGLKSFNEQDYRRAIDFFTKSLGAIRNDKIYLYRGKAFLYSDKYDKAIEDFLKDERMHPGRSSLDLSKAFAARGNTHQSVEYLKKHLKSPYRERWTKIVEDKFFNNISNDTIWQNFIQQQLVSDAEKLALSSEEKIRRNEFKEALGLVNASIKHEPANPDWYGLRAKIKLELGHYAEAVSDYKRELALDSKRKNSVYKSIAIVFARKGDLKRSSMLLEEIARKDTSQFHLLLDVAEVELERYDRKKALEVIDEYLSILPDDDEAYYIKANILDGEGAKEAIKKAIELCKVQNKKVPQKYQDFLKSFS